MDPDELLRFRRRLDRMARRKHFESCLALLVSHRFDRGIDDIDDLFFRCLLYSDMKLYHECIVDCCTVIQLTRAFIAVEAKDKLEVLESVSSSVELIGSDDGVSSSVDVDVDEIEAESESKLMLASSSSSQSEYWNRIFPSSSRLHPSRSDHAKALGFVHQKLAWSHFQLHEYDLAIHAATQALEMTSAESVVGNCLRCRARAYRSTGKYEEALEDFCAAIAAREEVGRSATIHYRGRGLTYYAMQDYGRALEDFTTALKMDSRDYRIYMNRGLVYIGLKRYEEAIDDITFGLRHLVEPVWTGAAHWRRGFCLGQLGRYEEASEDLIRSVELTPVKAGEEFTSMKRDLRKISHIGHSLLAFVPFLRICSETKLLAELTRKVLMLEEYSFLEEMMYLGNSYVVVAIASGSVSLSLCRSLLVVVDANSE